MKNKILKTAVTLSVLGIGYSGAAQAHIFHYVLNDGVNYVDGLTNQSSSLAVNTTLKNTNFSGAPMTGGDPCANVAAGTFCQSINDITRYGWYEGTQAHLGDSHYVSTNAEDIVFHVSQLSTVTITERLYNSNGSVNNSSNANAAFSVYQGVLPSQAHDDLTFDPLNPVNDSFMPIASPKDSAPIGHQYFAHDGYRDTVNNAYYGQFDAFANWSMANAGGQWSQINYIASASQTGVTVFDPNTNGNKTFGGNGLAGGIESLALTLAAGDYSIWVGAESGTCSASGGGGLCIGVNGATNQAVSAARLYATTSVNIAPSTVPVPGAVWLFGSALSGFVGIKRRKQPVTA